MPLLFTLLFAAAYFIESHAFILKQINFNSRKYRCMRFQMASSTSDDFSSTDNVYTESVEELEDPVEILPVVDEIMNEVNTTIAVDPHAELIKMKEAELAKTVSQLENNLRSERMMLSSTKDKLSETGKNGYFIIQAQVADFVKRREKDQKSRVRNNKKEFVNKMLPIVDSFREAPVVVPAESEREVLMHKTFGELLNSILIAFEKFGYKEFSTATGEKLDATKHQITAVEEDGTDGLVIRCVRPGITDDEGEVLRRSLVVASGKSGVVGSTSSSGRAGDADDASKVVAADDIDSNAE